MFMPKSPPRCSVTWSNSSQPKHPVHNRGNEPWTSVPSDCPNSYNFNYLPYSIVLPLHSSHLRDLGWKAGFDSIKYSLLPAIISSEIQTNRRTKHPTPVGALTPEIDMIERKVFMRIGGLVVAGGASFIYVKKVLTDRRRQRHVEEDRLREQNSGSAQETWTKDRPRP